MEARLNKGAAPNILCFKHSDWFTIWVNLEMAVPMLVDCWVDNIKLVYHNDTRLTADAPGVETRVPGWGTTSVVEYLDPLDDLDPYGYYLNRMCNALVRLGYVRDLNLLSAPYDFRKAPNENVNWFVKTKELIENAYEVSDGESVTLICHSMGCLMTLKFLQNQPQEWKDEYISKLITLAGPWGGSMKTLKVYSVGDDLDVPGLPAHKFREVLITWPSLAWILPSPYFWAPEEVLASTKTTNYSISNLEEFFTNLRYPTGWEMRKDTLAILNPTIPPNVEVHCLFGNKLPTLERLNFFSDDLTSKPEQIKGDGDSVVNIRSLRGCERWIGKQDQPVNITVFPGFSHFQGMVFNPDVINYISDILSD